MIAAVVRVGARGRRYRQGRPYVQLQTLFYAAWPPGRLYYVKSSVVGSLEEDAIDKYLDCA